MKLTDRRLYQARSLQDFRFRLGFEENTRRDVMLSRAFVSVLLEPDYLKVWGTDHSAWDGNVDFEITKQKGARFVFLKAQEGTVPTKYYIENTLRAKDVGLLDAPYHWLHQNAKVNCRLQAQTVWERTKPYVTQLPLMCDFEWTKFLRQWANPTYADLDIFVTEFTRISGIKPLLYSAAGFMNTYGKIPAWLLAKFSGLVVASYGTLKPVMPIGLTQYEFHQFAASGNAEIISPNDVGKKEVDLIYANTTKYGLTADPIPPPTGEPMTITFTGKVKSTAPAPANVRLDADTSATVVANLAPGVGFTAQGQKVTNDGFDWLNIITPTLGWLALTSNIEYQPVTPAPVPSPDDGVKVSIDLDLIADFNGKQYRASIQLVNVQMMEAAG